MNDQKSSNLWKIITARNPHRSLGDLQYYFNYVFQNIALRNRVVLEIGCGSGIMAAYIAHKEAEFVLGLEPEAGGSIPGHLNLSRKIPKALSLNPGRIQILPATIQEYDPEGVKFDVVLMHNSINHLDEKASTELHASQEARKIYLHILDKISGLLNDSGTLLILDCSRYNFWPLLGLRNPFCPEIQWEKHQPPELWIYLLRRCGLRRPKIQWTSFKTIRGLGKPLRNRFASYFFTSHFRLEMNK
jgi:SAM-dependent methyltransferase